MTDGPNDDGGGSGHGPSNRRRRTTYEIGRDERPSVAAVRAVAAFLETDPLALEPLYDVIDPDHLDGAVESAAEGTVSTDISFRFNDCEVRVTAGTVRVEAAEDDA